MKFDKWSAKGQLARGVMSIAFMGVLCTACGAMFDLQVVAASLVAVLVMSPATILFLHVERFECSKRYLKHRIYFAYSILWILLFTYAYLTAGELPEVALICMYFVTVAAISGYIPLLGNWRFSLRAILIVTTLVALMLGLGAYLAKKF
jgi:hypothetical protein